MFYFSNCVYRYEKPRCMCGSQSTVLVVGLCFSPHLISGFCKLLGTPPLPLISQ